MMPSLKYHDHELYMDDIPVKTIINQYGTPSYIYSFNTIAQQLITLQNALADMPHKIFFAVKANNNLAILNQFVKLNTGFDVVSIGELKRALKAGSKAESIIFSGVGKTREELEAAIQTNIHCINVESKQELSMILKICNHLQKKINIALRINPDIDAKTHQHISTGMKENKFGIPADEINDFLPELKSPLINLVGIACHIGSQITTFEPFKLAAQKMAEIASYFHSCHFNLSHIDLGGGLGISYDGMPPPSIKDYAETIVPIIKPLKLTLYLEPGRLLIGPAACLTTKVIYTKEHDHVSFAILDAGMNDFMRPALYDALHHVHPLLERQTDKIPYHLVGPVCESTDIFAKNYPLALSVDDYLVFDSAGAYGSSMSSRYNARPLIPEILIKAGKFFLIRKRELLEETYQDEMIIHE